MPCLLRQFLLNATWEGAGNVIALALLRAMGRDADGVERLRDFLDGARGHIGACDRWLDALDWNDAQATTARRFAERLARAAQAAVLIGWQNPLAETYAPCGWRRAATLWGL